MQGDVLYPLNALRTLYPDVYARGREKYAGREVLLELRIPILDVLWNDALHLSSFHPSQLAAAWRSAGLPPEVWDDEFFEIPIDRIAADRAVVFGAGALLGDSLEAADVVPFDAAAFRNPDEPPPPYHKFLRQRRESGRPARPFAYLPHILVAAQIDVAGVPVVRADVPPPATLAR